MPVPVDVGGDLAAVVEGEDGRGSVDLAVKVVSLAPIFPVICKEAVLRPIKSPAK